jgi:spore maturation protein SpmB
MRRLFPEVPRDHAAMGAMIMNLASNVLGLGNAATPFGLKAMTELDRLNPRPGVASDAMVLFLAINATSVAILPLGTIAVRAAAGSTAPASILVPTLIATTTSTLTAVGMHFLLRRRRRFRIERFAAVEPPAPAATAGGGAPEIPGPAQMPPPPGRGVQLLLLAFTLALAGALVLHVVTALATAGPGDVAREVLSSWLLPALIAAFLGVGLRGGVRVYESAVEGAREGLEVAVRIVPFLVVILVAVAMFRASGALDVLIAVLDPVTSRLGVPAEALPMALLRPLSGSGAFGVMSEILKTHGPDSFIGVLVSTYQGSTETTFYVLAVYFGSVGITKTRYAVACGLIADAVGLVGAILIGYAFYH